MDDPNSPFISLKDALKDEKRISYHRDYLSNLLASIKYVYINHLWLHPWIWLLIDLSIKHTMFINMLWGPAAHVNLYSGWKYAEKMGAMWTVILHGLYWITGSGLQDTLQDLVSISLTIRTSSRDTPRTLFNGSRTS